MKRIYITHCSAKKNPLFKDSKKSVKPEDLYTSQKTQGFIERCKDCHVSWAIFSDKYGVVFPSDRIQWYEKHPNSVSRNEYKSLLKNLIDRLSSYDEVWFYHNPGHFHNLYKRLLNDAELNGLKIQLFSKKNEIGSEKIKTSNVRKQYHTNRIFHYLETLTSGFQGKNFAIVEFSKNCKYAYVCTYGLSENIFQRNLNITILNLDTGRYLQKQLSSKDEKSPSNYIYSISADSENRYLLSGGLYGNLHLWDLHESIEVQYSDFSNEIGSIYQISFIPEEMKAIIGGINGVFLFDIVSNNLQKLIDFCVGYQNKISISHDGDYLAFSTFQKGLGIVQLDNRKTIYWKKFPRVFEDISYQPNSSIMLAGNEGGEVFAWDIQSGAEIAYWQHNINVRDFDVAIVKGKKAQIKRAPLSQGISVALANNSPLLASGSHEGRSLILYDLHKKKEILRKKMDRKITSLRFSPGDKALNVGFSDGWVYILGLKKR